MTSTSDTSSRYSSGSCHGQGTYSKTKINLSRRNIIISLESQSILLDSLLGVYVILRSVLPLTEGWNLCQFSSWISEDGFRSEKRETRIFESLNQNWSEERILKPKQISATTQVHVHIWTLESEDLCTSHFWSNLGHKLSRDQSETRSNSEPRHALTGLQVQLWYSLGSKSSSFTV